MFLPAAYWAAGVLVLARQQLQPRLWPQVEPQQVRRPSALVAQHADETSLLVSAVAEGGAQLVAATHGRRSEMHIWRPTLFLLAARPGMLL
jgi:hypothetical protein